MNRVGKKIARALLVCALGVPLVAEPAFAQPGGAFPQPQQTAPEEAEAAPAPAAPLTPEELEVLGEVEQLYERYAEAAAGHNTRMRTILRNEYEDRKTKLERRYAEKIDSAAKQERERRLAAIALLEKFIQDYPSHEQFTPDAMFRLADLYLDKANYDFEQSFDLFAEAPLPDEADPAAEGDGGFTGMRADYSKSLELWTQISTRFPEYRQRAGVLYLLAYYLNEIGETRPALQVARGLVCASKYDPMATPEPAPDKEAVRRLLGATDKAPYVDIYADCQPVKSETELQQDAWARIVGDIHFTTPGELNQAISAYSRVASDPESPFYDEALYKLAWSYYRNDDFLEGIEAFDKSIVHYDKLVAEGGEPLELRQEALQYIAISFTDPWSVDEQPDPQRSFDRAYDFYDDRLDEPHVRDVFVQLGDTFMLLEAYTQAADSYRIAVNEWPLHPTNPEVHQKIVNAFERLGDSTLADEEAARLASRYAPGTEWFEANETNREAMESQQRIGERMLRAAAENTHKSAQQARQDYVADPTPENKQRYLELYASAADLYRRFLETYPTSEFAYEFTYRLGETLYFSERYEEAIPHYTWVRDHRDLSSARFEKAARSIVQAHEAILERAVAAGTVQEPPIPGIEELRAMPAPIQPIAVPAEYANLQRALDEYQRLVSDPQTAPQMGYEAGLISYRHLDLDDAEARFQFTFQKFCGTTEAVQAKDALLAIYEARGQDDKFKETNDTFISSQCGTEEDVQLAKAQNRSKEFREAEDRFADGQYADAAIEFYRYYKTAPADDPSRPIALYNSAIAYERSGKPKTSVYLFQEFTQNPDPAFRKSEYYLPALYLTAVSYYKAFDYDKAVETYLDVVKAADEKGRKPPAGDRTLEQIKLDALFNAALLRELDRVYQDPRGQKGTGAASLYARYAELEPDRRKADRARWAVARVWRQAGNLNQLERAYTQWRREYGRDPGNGDDYVFTFYDLAKQNEKKGNSRAANKFKSETLKAWNDVGQPKGTAASDMAAEFAFEQAEAYYDKQFTPHKIKRAPTTKKQADRVLDELDALANRTKQKYLDLAKYESGPYGLAALVRVGDVLFFQGLKIAEIPVPKDIERLDARAPEQGILFQYQDAIAALVKPLEEAAKVQWVKVVDAGKQQGVSNEWTQLAQERLHDFVSQDEFPVLRPALREGTETP